MNFCGLFLIVWAFMFRSLLIFLIIAFFSRLLIYLFLLPANLNNHFLQKCTCFIW
jgi:hypothetical protein